MTVLAIVIIGFMCFCNGVLVAQVETRREDTSFHEEWEKEVNESQSSALGRMSMKAFYFIPTITSIISKKKSH